MPRDGLTPRLRHRFHIAALAIATAVCAWPAAAAGPEPESTWQYSTIDALLQGYYDGDATLSDVARHGDHGLGTINGLDGEMILIDGTFYQMRTDGQVNRLAESVRTPFAVVTPFDVDREEAMPAGLDIEGLYHLIDTVAPNRNLFLAIRIDGTFPAITVRSVPKQVPPYRPLVEIVRSEQVVFEFKDVRGTLIGFRCPEYVAGINVPGFHLHFLSDDRRQGGHLLGLTTGGGRIAIDEIAAFEVVLPTDAAFGALPLGGAGSNDLDAVEKQQR